MTENKIKENTFKPKPQPKQVIEDSFETKQAPEKKQALEKKTEKPKKEKAVKETKDQKDKKPHASDPRVKYIAGVLVLCLAFFLAISLLSFFVSYFNGSYHETGATLFGKAIQFDNFTGKFGSYLSQILVKESFGLGSIFFVYLLTIIGLRLTIGRRIKMWNVWIHAIMLLAWIPLLFGFINFAAPNKACEIFGGAVGKFLNANIYSFMGKSGVILTLVFVFLLYLLFQFNLNIDTFREWREKRAERRALKQQQQLQNQYENNIDVVDDGFGDENNLNNNDNFNDDDNHDEEDEIDPSDFDDEELPPITVIHRPAENTVSDNKDKPESTPTNTTLEVTNPSEDIKLEIEETPDEKTVKDGKEHHTIDMPFDPHYELSDYKFPTLDLLNDYGDKRAEVSNEELEANKNKIVETLGNYGIQIDKIKATIGPTVTLYEIVPAAGVRISKIKNLEDDIALSLAALGIRIIAPIPGKGTIGIEVPNKKPETVSMRSVLASEKFQNNKFALPCAIGKTISNETYVFDLAKMPHILMAGATGQGKSVGLNAIIASLLYSKHPSDLKFIMVDPKKVELTLYNRIERHYLAKLPDSEDAIITDVKQVVRTLNSLCIEMDQRYDLLKAAQCRNIIEYNEKFKARRLLPTEGHHYLPYIVLVVDEFADLIMTAGRDVEAPIARLAQLARAIGIHLIIATQRPSVNIITGSIKANFPARIAFRVISQVDSKTILDQSGANQLIGRGDMLLSTGNDMVRLQCAFIDTPEVEEVTSFIGEQRGFSEPFLLPEVPDEGEGGGDGDFEDGDERDSLFEEAARIVVQTQQGSTSMIQRKLKLGYNRAGRIIDQLEAAGIVGPFSGSKSREVKVANEFALEQILKDLELKDQGI
ncbi:MAG: DNA translocase FtsK 4TM domain-containing protein [Bacteroidales bacterium]|nr:DNA translocase FtsK 4TM domain-containing protein [Bacteroidales bacterium]